MTNNGSIPHQVLIETSFHPNSSTPKPQTVQLFCKFSMIWLLWSFTAHLSLSQPQPNPNPTPTRTCAITESHTIAFQLWQMSYMYMVTMVTMVVCHSYLAYVRQMIRQEPPCQILKIAGWLLCKPKARNKAIINPAHAIHAQDTNIHLQVSKLFHASRHADIG